jgi:hypothetical protein
MDTTTIALHTAEGAALSQERVRETVMAAASSLAERFNIDLLEMDADDETLTVELGADEVTSLGFAAELRRNTNTWYEGKYKQGPLWRTPTEF